MTQPGNTPPRKTARNILLAASVVVVVAVAAVVVPRLTDDSSGTGDTGARRSADCTTASFELDEGLAGNLTLALQKHDKTKFLSLATTPATKSAMTMWWHNVDALGFVTGGAQVETGAQSAADSPRRVKIGFHNHLDSMSKDTDERATPDTPATEYQLGVKQVRDGGATSTACHLAITGWQSLSNAPWDVGHPLSVVKTRHIVIAGEQSMSSEVHRIAPIAEKAAVWDQQFFARAKRSSYLDMSGFLVFVPSNAQEEQRWFRAPTAKKPSGWVADVGGAAGIQFPLPGVQIPMTLPPGMPELAPLSTNTGGGRVILTATGRHASNVNLEATLVHEFVHAIFANDDIGAYLGGKPVPGAVSEGAARWIESYFYSSPDDANSPNLHALPTLKNGLRPYFSSFDGRWPSNDQIYGSAATADYYYDLAATTFDYEASYGLEFAVQCVLLAYTNGGGPFTGVELSNKGGTIKFADPNQEQGKWATWIRQMMAG